MANWKLLHKRRSLSLRQGTVEQFDALHNSSIINKDENAIAYAFFIQVRLFDKSAGLLDIMNIVCIAQSAIATEFFSRAAAGRFEGFSFFVLVRIN
ncbi:hypothetical protein [Nostoc favosum]|uniref:Uncharacterized protein n=1 Tax=Nostoc favosum CHAB5714 TaxID=2780399 RepID=A0ABS8I3H2_9NOSO|nr:hypothetical protein [Nostoc favosum]MCC5598733.1 hypothetical protein [Nostoc favosum CHAB5714]